MLPGGGAPPAVLGHCSVNKLGAGRSKEATSSSEASSTGILGGLIHQRYRPTWSVQPPSLSDVRNRDRTGPWV